MDDFLHNLRSGKLKQADRSNRPYGDQQYKGNQRRNAMDRRKRDFEAKESFERLNAIKEVLETLADTQKQMAEAYQARTLAEERKARAMEILAKNLYQMLNPGADNVEELFASEYLPEPEKEKPISTAEENLSAGPDTNPDTNQGAEQDADEEVPSKDNATYPQAKGNGTESKKSPSKLTEIDRHTLYSLIGQLREDGKNWEHIARQIAAQGYPTVSGKGSWRGVMAKNLFEKMATQ